MTVKELIEKLKEIKNQDAKVYVPINNDDGCETCGWGETMEEEDVWGIDDLGDKVWLSID